MLNTPGRKEYTPQLISRRGETIAWITATLTIIGWAILLVSGRAVSPAIPFLAVFLVFSGMAISLGNWMDRKTNLIIDDDGLEFRNGLRHLRILWKDIDEVRVSPSKWGKKVQVYGQRAYFFFRTLSEVKVQDEIKGKFGFEQGDDILRQIILNSGLEIVDRQGEGYYYARK